ncbi:hypothetical protein [Amycolatopsis sp. PS_44_ISF1]|uniref:hypothetical protein n=1 Tax=Amycolatopsis sp. PS_44_ISF1 TaxID=2974917 RepID=UPI0028DE8726|nr:hypothetical protein [Amycolatopsis sp. PS_44_ISF1]MDT8909569.1 hypothetical protein [Amycolatopsis sp. PS_44_ISF1]
MVDLKTAVGALRSDAGVWKQAAESLSAPHQAIGALGLTPADVSMYGVDRGIDKIYANAQNTVLDLLRQAADNFHSLADALNNAATMYEENEADFQQRIKDVGGH